LGVAEKVSLYKMKSTTTSHKRHPSNNTAVADKYVSPVKRAKEAVRALPAKRVFETVDGTLTWQAITDTITYKYVPVPYVVIHTIELKAFMQANNLDDRKVAGSVVLQYRLVWTSFSSCRTGPVARFHLIYSRAPESLGEMHKVRSSLNHMIINDGA
jgi:hypothetical protein